MGTRLYSTSCTRLGPTRQRIEHKIELPNGETLTLSSSGRSHTVNVEVLGVSEKDEAGESNVSVGSRQVDGAMPHQEVDFTVAMKGYRVHVKSWGRSHSVDLS